MRPELSVAESTPSEPAAKTNVYASLSEKPRGHALWVRASFLSLPNGQFNDAPLPWPRFAVGGETVPETCLTLARRPVTH